MAEKQKVIPYRNLDVGTTGAVVRSNPCALAYLYVYNSAAVDLFLKIYDKATAASETDTPVHTFPIPTRSGAVLNLVSREVPFLNGISIRASTGVADNDTGAPAANNVIVNLGTVNSLGYGL